MGGTQSFNAPRSVSFAFDPDDLVLIEDPKDPLYDVRVTLPLKPEFVASVRTSGVIVPVVVRKRDGQAVVLDGRQRVKAAREVNRQLAEAGSDIRIKVQTVERKGNPSDAFAVTVVTNEHRQDDALRTKIEKAQRLANFGRTEEEIAGDFGVGVPTIRKWLDTDAAHKPPRKARGAFKGPKMLEIREVIRGGKIVSGAALAALRWVSGEISTDDLHKILSPEFGGLATEATT